MLFFSLKYLYGYILVLGVMQILAKCASIKRASSWDLREEPKLGDIYLTVPSESEDEREALETTTIESMTVAPDEFIATTANLDENRYLTEDTTISEDSSSSVTLSWAELFMILQRRAFPPEARTSHKKGPHSLTASATSTRESIESSEALQDAQTIVDNLLKYNRETGEQLVKLKNLLTSSNRGNKSPRVKIKINAQAPLHIRTEFTNEKNVLSKGVISVFKKRDKILNDQSAIKKEKLENRESTIGPPLDQETDGEIEKVRKQFIQKGANFLRQAWSRYLKKKLKPSQRNEDLDTDE